MKKPLILILFFLFCQYFLQAQNRNDSFFKTGDKITFIGNSITHGTVNTGRFHNYILLYHATRFPNEKIDLYNAGIWGDNANGMARRMEDDYGQRGADVFIIMAGMNDVNRELYNPDRQNEPDIETKKQRALSDYKGYLKTLIQKVRTSNTNARVIIQKPTVFDENVNLSGANRPGVNNALQQCTVIIDELVQEFNGQGIVLQTVDYWTLLNTLNQDAQQINPTATLISNDRIHPGNDGNFIMAYQFLKSTQAPKYVANLEIKDGTVIKNEFCTISGLAVTPGSVNFKYKSQSLPFPITDNVDQALSLIPFHDELNAEMLKISSLDAGKYELNIDGNFVTSFTANELSSGINLALQKNTPQYLQALAVKSKTDAHRDLQVKLRDIKLIEINYLAKSLWADFATASAYINDLKDRNVQPYTSQKSRFDAYLINKPNEAALEQELASLTDEIFTLNQPVEHTFEIKFSSSAQTHFWGFDGPVSANKVEGWTITNYSNSSTSNSILSLSSSNQQYCNIRYFTQAPNQQINPAISKKIVIKLKNATDVTKSRFYWWSSLAQAAYIEFDISANDTDFKEYTINLGNDNRWGGEISSIRFDLPFPFFAAQYGKFIHIDYIKLLEEGTVPSKSPAPFGVNVAGAEFGEGTPHYSYPTTAELDYFKAKGLKLFRLPFKWERIQPALNGALDATELSKMKAFVDAAQERGLWVLLDMHNYGKRLIPFTQSGTKYTIGSPEVSVAHVTDTWKKLANEFKDYNNIWGYGVMNEPNAMLPATPWKDIAQAIITGIRQIDSKTTIVVGGDSWSSAARWQTASDNLKTLVDPSNNLIFEAHVYFDKDASGSYKNSYDIEEATDQTGVERVKPFINWLKANGLRGFIGEYGIPNTDPRWLTVLDKTLEFMQQNNVNGTYWAAGPRWNDYVLSVQPKDGQDRVQMAILEKYLYANESEDPLPVKFISFTAKQQNNTIVLNWSTASESNNSHFDVMHADNRGTFMKIGTIKGNNSSIIKNYEFLHLRPEAGTNYYQLNQVDYDGISSKSNIITAVQGMLGEATKVYISQNNKISLKAERIMENLFRLSITDITGKEVAQYNDNLSVGSNLKEFSMKPLSPGIYVITYESATEKLSTKVLIE